MLVHNPGGLQCLAIFLLLALFATGAQGGLFIGGSDVFSSTSSDSSLSTVTAPFGNSTSMAFTSSHTTTSPDSVTTTSDTSASSFPTDSTSSRPVTGGTSTSSLDTDSSSITTPTTSATSAVSFSSGTSTPSSSTGAGGSVLATSNTSTSFFPTNYTNSVPPTGVTAAATSSFESGTSVSSSLTNATSSTPASSPTSIVTTPPRNGSSTITTSSTPTASGTAPRADARCGSEFNGATCDPAGPFGGCCSEYGYCGSTVAYCLVSNGCQLGCTNQSTTAKMSISSPLMTSTSPMPITNSVSATESMPILGLTSIATTTIGNGTSTLSLIEPTSSTPTSIPASSVTTPTRNETSVSSLTGSSNTLPPASNLPTSSLTSTGTAPFGNGTSTSPPQPDSTASISPNSFLSTTATLSNNGTTASPYLTDTSAVGFSTTVSTPSTITTQLSNGTGTSSNPLVSTPTVTNVSNIGSYRYIGCARSPSNFSTFTLALQAPDMTIEKCVSQCKSDQYAGLFYTKCLCAVSLGPDVSVTSGVGSCTIPCPGNQSEFCGGGKEIQKRQGPIGILLSLFGNTDLTLSSATSTPTTIVIGTATPFGNGTSVTSSNPPSSTNALTTMSTVGTATPFGNGTSVTSSNPPSSTNTLITMSTIGTATPLGNETSVTPSLSFSTGLLGSALTVNSITTQSAPYGNTSSTYFSSPNPTNFLNSSDTSSVAKSITPYEILTTITFTLSSVTNSGSLSSSQSSTSPTVLTLTSQVSVTNVPVITSSPPAGSITSGGFTITEIIYTTTSFCPATVNTTISGTPFYTVTNSVSTIILTSTIIIPCNKCPEPSRLITLPPAVKSSGPYQSPLPSSPAINEVTVTEIIYMTLSTCHVTLFTSVSSGLTPYYVTDTVSTLTLTATWTVSCERCSPPYTTVTVMLIRESSSGEPGYAPIITTPFSSLVTPLHISPTYAATPSSCPGCDNPPEETVEIDSTGALLIPTYPPSSHSPTAPSSCPSCGNSLEGNVGISSTETMGVLISSPSGHSPSGHSPSGHSPSGHSPSGHSPSDYSTSGYSPSGHSPSGHSPSGHSPSGHSPSGHSPSGHSPSGHSPSGHSPSGHSPSDYSTSDYSTSGHSPSGHSLSGHSPSDYSPSGHSPVTSSSCSGCSNPSEENVGTGSVKTTVTLASSPSSHSPVTSSSCSGCSNPSEESVKTGSVKTIVTLASSPSSHSPATPSNCPGCGNPLEETVGISSINTMAALPSPLSDHQPAAPASGPVPTSGGGPSTTPAGSSMTATSTPLDHGPYLTGGSVKSLKILGQSFALGLLLAVIALLVML